MLAPRSSECSLALRAPEGTRVPYARAKGTREDLRPGEPAEPWEVLLGSLRSLRARVGYASDAGSKLDKARELEIVDEEALEMRGSRA